MADQNKVLVIIGSQWGDEGKGKLVDLLAEKSDIVARFNGGANAGHTIIVNGVKYAFHLLPSGVLYDHVTCVIGNGVVMNVPTFFGELEALEKKNIKYEGRIKISDRAHLVTDLHLALDRLGEEARAEKKIGTTKKGIGPTYSTKMTRSGLRVADLIGNFDHFAEKFNTLYDSMMKAYPTLQLNPQEELEKYRQYAKQLAPFVIDSITYVNEAHKAGKKIMVEGANATMLDIDFGTYPYVTSSNCTVGGACTGLGISPLKIGTIVGIVKAYCTRVGEGPFPTEVEGEVGHELLTRGHEYGTTTGRPRRCGWLDIPELRYSHAINSFTDIGLTKLDILSAFKEIKIGTAYMLDGKEINYMPADLDVLKRVEVVYETLPGWEIDISKMRKFEELPETCRKYVERVEQLAGVHITYIGVGAGREDIIIRQ
jgi:adenylosuccinate synthase